MGIFKKILIILMCLMISSSRYSFLCAEETSNASRTYEKGDVNGDGKISALDYVTLRNFLKKGRSLPDQYKDAADANSDGVIDDYDLLRLKNMVYYGEAENLSVSVSSKTIHPQHQKSFLQEGYTSISKYWNKGQYPAEKIFLEFGEDVIPYGNEYTVLVSEKPDMSYARSYTTNSRSVYIENSKTEQLYFWTVSNGSETSDLQSFYVDDHSPRNLSYPNLENLRDIGGYETEDNMRIKQGMVYRGYQIENNRYLSNNRNFLKNELGIKTEIDIAKCTTLINADNYYSYYIGFPISGTYLKPSYTGVDKNSIVQVFDVLGDESKYPVYIHCHIGTDRTGFLCFLMNALCGVSKEDCYTDYVFSGFSGNLRSSNGLDDNAVKLIEAAPGRTFAEKTYNLLVKRGVNPESLDNFIAIMKEKKANTKTFVPIPEVVSPILHFDGSEKTLRFTDDYLFNIKGNKATSVGEYLATVSLKDPYTYSWADGSKSDKVIAWTIEDVREPVAKPNVVIDSFVYDGKEKEVLIEEQDYYEVSGNKATNAGEYEAIVSLSDKEKYVWEDGSNDDLSFAWNIEKADIDVSQIVFEDASYEYDGSEKALTYVGDLPEGVKSVSYSDNVLIGNPYKESSTEAILSFELENDNYNPIENMTAVLTILPIYDDLKVNFDEDGLESMQIIYGEEYSLPVLEKEGEIFDGWYVMIDGELVKVEQSGIWEYELSKDEITLVPMFTSIGESDTVQSDEVEIESDVLQEE